jgi:hypothetical protein
LCENIEKKRYEEGKENFMKEVKLFLKDSKKIDEIIIKLKYEDIIVIKDLNYRNYDYRYVENLYYKVNKKDSIILNGCIIASDIYRNWNYRDYDFFRSKISNLLSKKKL